jgi:CubicO group peptidase (beta-lactamase class C family)
MTGLGDLFRRLFGFLGTSAAENPAAVPARDVVDPLLRSAMVPGTALARIDDGQVSWVAGYGHCGSSPFAPPISAGTVFQAASVSKPVTALAVLELVDRGLLDLDAPVAPLLAFAIPEHPILARRPGQRRAVTVRLLLQHRSGIAGRGTTPTSNSAMAPADKGGGSLRFLQRRGVDLPSIAQSWAGTAKSTPITLTYPPGTAVSYSGAGYLVLQHLVEQVTGRSFDDHLSPLLPRLGAPEATFALHSPPGSTLARGHDTNGRSLPGGHELVPWSAAGGLFITATGLAEVVATMVRRCDDIISDELMDEVYVKNIGVFSRQIDGNRAFHHGGDNGGYRASITGVPATGVGWVVLTNGRSSSGTTTRVELARLVRDHT